MAQISYGTITITDTNDIERIYVVYAKHTSNTDSTGLPAAANWKESIAEAPGSGNYIWQRTVVKKSGIITPVYGNPVCITGPQGIQGPQGPEGEPATNITDIQVQYGISANWSTQPNSWSNNSPDYDSTKPNYWTRTRLVYEGGTYSDWIISQDHASTETIANAVEANYNAAVANSIAQSANENAQGAMSQSTETQYQTDLLKAQVKNYWWDSTGAHIASGILRSGQTEADDVDKNNSNTYGFNSLVGLGSLTFGYNSYKAVELDGGIPALKFYKPSTTAQGDLTATLNSDGLILSEGGIESGTLGLSGFVYLSTKDYPSNVTINEHQADNWRQIIGTNFGIDSDGQIYAANANIAGTIEANNGTIGGFTINSTSIYNGIDSITPSENLQPGEREAGVYLGIDGFRNIGELGSTTIQNGVLTADGAHIRGTVIIGENSGSNIYTKDEVYNKNEVYNSAQIDNTINELGENISKTAWTVWISVKNIDYINSTATLQAVVYHYGEKITEGYNCQWYKNDILIPDETDIELSINTDGQTPEDLSAFYTCIIYDGLNQSLASDSFDLKTAQEAGELKKYIIRESEQEGIKIYDTEAHTNYAHINSDGMSVIKNNSLIAQFGDKIILGPQNSYHIEIGADENSQEPEVGFYGDSGKVAYINASQLYINRSVVVQEMLVGKEAGTNNNQWAWRYDENDKSIYLKWLG